MLCALVCPARADFLPGSYTYKLVLRDDLGFALCGAETSEDDERVSSNYKIEVYNAEGDKINAELLDWSLDGDRDVGCNCTLAVSVGEKSGCAKKGEQLTLVVKASVNDSERFRSSKVLPPVGGSMGFAGAPVGVFFGDAGDTDLSWDSWLRAINSYLPDGASIGGPDDDYDNDGLSNMREYQLGTDPAGGALGLANVPGFTIQEQGNAYKVSFSNGWGHVYSIRAIEGMEAVGVDGQDLALYESPESLNSDSKWGTYFYDGDYNVGTKTFFVKKPTQASYLIGLAVDGRLLEYIQVGSEAVEVAPGFPIEYESEEKATAAKAIAAIVPSEAVAAVLTGEGMADAYKAKFTTEVKQKDDKWFLSAELTPQALTNLMESAAAATRQIPVAEIALLSPEATTNVVLTLCTPGFYYSLNCGADLKNIAPDAETENLGVLCGANGEVEFPSVGKPSEGVGFFKVSISISEGE
jgi:hypothetical protein